ncbi:hypothetical protein NUSPORA_02695 [Nucleospora cyclopteri]
MLVTYLIFNLIYTSSRITYKPSDMQDQVTKYSNIDQFTEQYRESLKYFSEIEAEDMLYYYEKVIHINFLKIDKSFENPERFKASMVSQHYIKNGHLILHYSITSWWGIMHDVFFPEHDVVLCIGNFLSMNNTFVSRYYFKFGEPKNSTTLVGRRSVILLERDTSKAFCFCVLRKKTQEFLRIIGDVYTFEGEAIRSWKLS